VGKKKLTNSSEETHGLKGNPCKSFSEICISLKEVYVFPEEIGVSGEETGVSPVHPATFLPPLHGSVPDLRSTTHFHRGGMFGVGALAPLSARLPK